MLKIVVILGCLKSLNLLDDHLLMVTAASFCRVWILFLTFVLAQTITMRPVLASSDSLPPCPVHSGFSVAQYPICMLDPVQFINGSWNAMYYQWFFNGALFSCDEHPLLQISSAGCHHIVLISSDALCSDTSEMWINVHPAYHVQFAVYLCPGEVYWFEGHELSMSGIYTAEYTTIHGCDSIIDLFLQVDTLKTGFQIQGSSAIASAGNKFYQWYDCASGFAPVAGACSPYFSPLSSGSYALVTGNNNCTDTSECQYIMVIGVDKNHGSGSITMSPNPARESVSCNNLKEGVTYDVVVTTTDGRIVRRALVTAGSPRIALHDISPGLYLVRISNPDETPVCFRIRVE